MAGPDARRPIDPGAVARLLGFVADRDEPCPVCEYSLRGLSGPTCPECGAELTLQVGSPRLRVGAWALAIVSFALGLGFDGVVGLMITVVLAISPAPVWQPYGLAAVFWVLSGSMLAGLVWVVRRRGAWHKQRVRTQWVRGVSIFAAVGLLHALVGAGLMLSGRF